MLYNPSLNLGHIFQVKTKVHLSSAIDGSKQIQFVFVFVTHCPNCTVCKTQTLHCQCQTSLLSQSYANEDRTPTPTPTLSYHVITQSKQCTTALPIHRPSPYISRQTPLVQCHLHHECRIPRSSLVTPLLATLLPIPALLVVDPQAQSVPCHPSRRDRMLLVSPPVDRELRSAVLRC